jgi:hypothetical protein
MHCCNINMEYLFSFHHRNSSPLPQLRSIYNMLSFNIEMNERATLKLPLILQFLPQHNIYPYNNAVLPECHAFFLILS